MATVIEKIHLVKSDPVNNNNKFWIAELLDDGNVHFRWGRVGDHGQEQTKPGGRSLMEKKVQEKLRSGRNGEIAYRKVDIIGEENVVSAQTKSPSLNKTSLKDIAKKQIKYNDPETPKLIEYLTDLNIHNICSYSSNLIKYNYDTGMFQTAMGPVGQSTITEARGVLSGIADLVQQDSYGDNLLELTRDILMLIPQDIGRQKLELRSFWNSQKVKEQNDLLDGLEASLAKAIVPDQKAKQEPEEQVFDTTLELVTDKKEEKALFDDYHATKHTMHSCYHYNPIKAWRVNIKSMEQAFKKDGAKMDNIVKGYHGSGTANMLSLLKTGMSIRPPANAAIAGALFGPGIYCAPMKRIGATKLTPGAATKALGYSTGYWGGNTASRTFMFICDMAMGKFYIPQASNYTRISYPQRGYDSTWAYGGESGVRNDEAIVYRSSQVNITYLLEFKR